MTFTDNYQKELFEAFYRLETNFYNDPTTRVSWCMQVTDAVMEIMKQYGYEIDYVKYCMEMDGDE